MRCLIVLPTYNEHDNLRIMIEGIRQHAPLAHVVIVDDESPDGTGELADELSKEQPEKIFVLHRRYAKTAWGERMWRVSNLRWLVTTM